MTAPKLRFKEFNKDWDRKKISELFTEVKDKVLDKKIETYSITAGTGFVSQAEKFGRDISGQQNSKYIVLEPNDFSYNKGNSKTYKYGCVYLNEFSYSIAVPNVFISFRAKDTRIICQKFYTKLFEKHYLDSYLRLLISSSARMDGLLNISKEGFFNINLPIPMLEEQTKIATFLSAVDEKIAQLSKKLYLLDQYKQGMMQKLFSQQIRFKADDGSEFREWKIGKLGDITSIQGGFAFKSTNFGKGMTKVIRIGDIEKNINLDSFTGIYSNEIPDTRYLISENAIVMALSGATFGKLGKVNQGYAYINQRVATFKVFEDSLNEFVYQIMLSQEFTTYIQSIPSASAQPNISNQDVINFEMMIPCLEEQTKIANFLSAIDQKINVVSGQLEQAKLWKKGLLQQMFV